MLIVHDVALNNGAGQMTTMDADTPSDAQETSSSDADCDGFFESEGVVDGADGLGTYNQNAVAASSRVPLPADDNPSVEGSTSHEKEVSLPSFNAKDACRYYQNPRQNAARAAARVVFVTPFRQDEVARAQSALRGPPQELSRRPKATKRQATDSDTTRRAKGKKKADQQSKPDPFSYASPTFQSPQGSPNITSYRYMIPPLAPCSELAPWQALYVFQHPYEDDMMSPVLIQWIDMHRSPVFPEELDLVFVICQKDSFPVSSDSVGPKKHSKKEILDKFQDVVSDATIDPAPWWMMWKTYE
ncbi:hypothetical protein CPB85DRAFT_1437989 [Mucidula mucida]|nr:hypothetical protein CPB85DRAFT_1437989 [Mucidula mucida]